MTDGLALESTERIVQLRERIESKTALRLFYASAYERFAKRLASVPSGKPVLEIGSGGGFLKRFVPDAITSDIIPYEGLDRQVDARQMSFPDGSLRAIFMLNVFHHLADCERFLREATRCLVPGGIVYIVDQYPGWLSYPIYRYAHHEPFDASAKSWRFDSEGPLRGANGALTWIVFERDRGRFQQKFPQLRLDTFAPHSPLLFWLAGGLKRWTLAPGIAARWVQSLDRGLCRLQPRLASFVDVVLQRA